MRTNLWLTVVASLVLIACGESGGAPCASDRMCSGSGQVCDPIRGVCVDCNVDRDCIGADEVCRANACVAVTPCTSSRECPGLVCDRDRGFCVECVSDVDCPGGEICDPDGVCEPPPTPCVSDRQCADEGRVCDTVGGVCVDCVRDADCDLGLVCVANSCQRGAVDTGVPDGSLTDSGPADSAVRDSGVTDSGVMDSGVTDSGATDSGVMDSGVMDSGAMDSGAMDSGAMDSGVADSGSDAGPCDGACLCARAASTGSGAGCEFWPTVTPTSALVPDHDFGVEITNGETITANVSVFRGATLVAAISVAPLSSAQLPLPRIAELDFSTDNTRSVLVAGGAYRLTATSPVRVRQMSALDAELPMDCVGDTDPDIDGRCPSFTTDGSTLLPTHRFGNAYTTVSRPALMFESTDIIFPSTVVYRSFTAIVATRTTTVTVLSTADITASSDGAVPAIGVGSTSSIVMSAGDVLVLVADNETPCPAGSPTTPDGLQTICIQSPATDLTGTRITATQPVQVIGGHDCAFVPETVFACDQLQAALVPHAELGTEYVATSGTAIAGETSFIRVVGVHTTSTTISFDPAIASPIALLRGEYQDVEISNAVHLSGNRTFVASQFRVGGNAVMTTDHGDPGMTQLVPFDNFSTAFELTASGTFTHHVELVAPVGAAVFIDGATVTGFTNVGASGYRVSQQPLTPGFHRITSSVPVGGTLLGTAQYVGFLAPAAQ